MDQTNWKKVQDHEVDKNGAGGELAKGGVEADSFYLLTKKAPSNTPQKKHRERETTRPLRAKKDLQKKKISHLLPKEEERVSHTQKRVEVCKADARVDQEG